MSNRRIGVKIPRTLIIRLPRLMEMQYTVAEIACELACSPTTVRTLLVHGCPHQRDDNNRVWIVGTDLAQWATATLQRNRQPLEPDQAWCCRCNRAVTMVGPLSVRPSTAHLELVSGTCATCGTPVNRGRARSR